MRLSTHDAQLIQKLEEKEDHPNWNGYRHGILDAIALIKEGM